MAVNPSPDLRRVLPLLAVNVDFGAASPLSIRAAARGVCEIAFICDQNLPYVRENIEELHAWGDQICDITGLTPDEADAAVAALSPDGMVTFSEHRIRQTTRFAAACGVPYHDPAVAEALTDKHTQRSRLAAAGVDSVRCQPIRSATDLEPTLREVGLPAVLKPRRGAASMCTAVVADIAEAAAHLVDFQAVTGPSTEFVVEELLRGDPDQAGPGWGDYVSVESVVRDGTPWHVAVTGKLPLAEPFRETGYFFPATLGQSLHRQATDLTRRALAALGVRTGVTHTEAKLTAEGPRIIEVNGRLGGYVADILHRATGFDLTRAVLRLALRQPVEGSLGTAQRCAFQYFLSPPPTARAIRRIAGVDEVTRLPEVQAVEMFKTEGAPLDWRRGTVDYVGIVHGFAADHQRLRFAVQAIERAVRIDYIDSLDDSDTTKRDHPAQTVLDPEEQR